MHVSVINTRGQHQWVEYDPYEEDAAQKNAVIASWIATVIARLQMPWFIPRLRRVEESLRMVGGGGA